MATAGWSFNTCRRGRSYLAGAFWGSANTSHNRQTVKVEWFGLAVRLPFLRPGDCARP